MNNIKKPKNRPTHSAIQPLTSAPFSHHDMIAAAGAGLAALIVYLFTLGPTVTGEDSGELITAAYTMGIAHPPAYPLWCMLGKLFSVILPLGSVAWRVNLLSGVLGAVTTSLLVLIIIRLTRDRVAAVAAALIFAFSRDFWNQCTIAEAYSLNSALIALCLLILIIWQESRRNALLYAFATVYGLNLCNHHTAHFFGPMFAAFILMNDYAERGGNAKALAAMLSRWRTYLIMLVITITVWSLVHLYLPVRSLANPPMDWGNPETWENFWNVVLRRQYGSHGIIANSHSLQRLAVQVYAFASMYLVQFTPLLCLIPFFGVRPLCKHDRLRAALFAGGAVYIALGLIVILNFDTDRQSLWVNAVFFIPAHMLATILMGTALAHAPQRIPSAKPALKKAVPVIIVLLPLIPLLAHYRANDRSQYYWIRDNAMNIFNSLEPNAVYFPTGDHRVFPLIYLQTVENVRPDVVIADKYGYIEERLYEKMPAPMRASLSDPVTENDITVIEDWIIANNPAPIYFSKKREIKTMPDTAMLNAGLVYKVVRKGEQSPARDYWSEYDWHTLDPDETRGEYSADIVLSDYHYFLGQHYFEKGQVESALEEMELAAKQIGRCKENLNNIAIVCVENKQYEAGRKYYEMALDVDPTFIGSLRNLARILALLNEPQQAVHCLDRAVQSAKAQYGPRGPILAACLSELATLSAGMVPIETTVTYYRQAIEAAQNDPAATIYFNNLGVALLEQGNAREAAAWFDRALQTDQTTLGPNHPDVGRDLSNLSIAVRKLGNLPEADRLQQAALGILTTQAEDSYMMQQAKQGLPIVALGK